MTHLAISIPAYNDSETLKPLVKESLEVLSRLTDSYEVFVINDGSKDETSQVLREICNKNSRVRIFEHVSNCGFGITIKEIYTLPESEWIFFIPGDGQISPSELLKLYPYSNRHQFILGRRKKRNDPLIRKINSFCYNLVISLLSGKRVHDVNSVGLIKKEVLNGIELKSRSAFIHAEILLKIFRQGASVTEIEIEHKPRLSGRGSGSKLKVIFSTVKDMIKYFFRIL